MSNYTKRDVVIIGVVLFLLLIIFTVHCSPNSNTKIYGSTIIILLILTFVLLFSIRQRYLGLLLLIFFLFSLYFYFAMVLYTIEPFKGGGFESWNSNMKELCSEMWSTEVYGRQNYHGPVIYALYANHCVGTGLIDFMSFGFIDPKARVVIKDPGQGNPINRIVDTCIKIKYEKDCTKGNYERFTTECKKILDQGTSVLIFPEGHHARFKGRNLEDWRFLTKLKSGTFKLAYENRIPIVPVIQEHYRSKGWLFTPGKFKIHLLKPLDSSLFTNPEELQNQYRKVMLRKLKIL